MSARLRLLFGQRRSPLRMLPAAVRAHIRRRYLRARTGAVVIGDGTILARVLGQLKLYLPAADTDITPHLALDGWWEPWVTAIVVDRLRPGDTAIDVGANVGYFTLLMARLVGPAGRVLAFEPHPDTAALLRRSVRANGAGARVACHLAPLAAMDGEAFGLAVPDGQPGGAYLSPVEQEDARALAPSRRLDGIVGALDAVLVKLDAEGSEERIWQGMAGLLAGNRLRWVVIEFSRDVYRDPAALLASAVAHRFALFRVETSARLTPVTTAMVLAGPTQQMLLLER